ncbi:DUF736 family protein [Sphingopyxis sp. JAI128]|uniref:DUF736 domain-containing protein n=1 Tax=Sphingopyxis sp. JAI128 TaxID=2723066 RepID=UPI0017C2AE96|nr:DUF736 family protein [Sphingopyxis sp. JAI128]MBB6427685.1 uncharacterized protein (DUF736 family) [Sphingopyxis sp. JAI128]
MSQGWSRGTFKETTNGSYRLCERHHGKRLRGPAQDPLDPRRSKSGPTPPKNGDVQPDYRVYSEGVEIGAGWVRIGEASGKPFVSLTLAAPEFGPRRIYANLGRAAGQDSEDAYAIIWNPAD